MPGVQRERLQELRLLMRELGGFVVPVSAVEASPQAHSRPYLRMPLVNAGPSNGGQPARPAAAQQGEAAAQPAAAQLAQLQQLRREAEEVLASLPVRALSYPRILHTLTTVPLVLEKRLMLQY
jgi:hypothetical protein